MMKPQDDIPQQIIPIPQGYDPAWSGMMSQGSNKDAVLSALKEITNEEDTIKEVRFILSGVKEINVTGKVTRVKYHDELMNEAGVSQVIAYMYGYLSKNITLSCLSEKYIEIKTRQFWTNIGVELGSHWIQYGIKSKSTHAQIRGILTQHVYSQLTRALNGLTIIKTLENTNINEHRTFDNPDRRGGFLGLGNIFRGR